VVKDAWPAAVIPVMDVDAAPEIVIAALVHLLQL
jgi:hypothetical protein